MHKAEANFAGQNGKRHNFKPEMVAVKCKGKKSKGGHKLVGKAGR